MSDAVVRRVAALLRVSTTSVEQEESPENQLAYIREEIRRRSNTQEVWIDTELVYEDELTGALVLERPGIRRLMEDAQAGLIDIVATKSISRLGRDTLGLLGLKRRLWDDMGVDLVALQDGYRASRDPELIFLVYADRAQAGRQEIANNVRTAMRQKALRGQWTAGMVPFGYRRKGRNAIEPHPETAPIVKEIFRLRAQGWGMSAIVRHLNETLRVPPPSYWHQWADKKEKLAELAATDERWAGRYVALTKKFSARKPLWRVSSLAVILKNTAYKGELKYFRRYWKRSTGGQKKLTERPAEEHITLPCPPLVDEETWHLAQELRQRRVARGQPERNKFLLQGLVFCAECGSRMSGFSAFKHQKIKEGRTPYFYYICQRRRDSGVCKAKLVRADRLEDHVWQHLSSVLETKRTGPAPDMPNETRTIEQRVKQLETRLNDAKDEKRYYRNEHRLGRVTDAELEEEISRLTSLEREIAKQLEQARRDIHNATLGKTKEHSIVRLWQEVVRCQGDVPLQTKRRLLVAAVKRIEASADSATVHLSLSID